MLHILISCPNCLEAALALGGGLPSGALVAQNLVDLCAPKSFFGTGVQALGTVEAGFVPAAVL